ncbi:transcriptional regulator, PadR-like family [Beutenbergia cavernae DSM 12333]|uniref:Transcriptional regulator, PadR-like family n=1 Tax=Beutenbergia cavernae (strain ATCC BAA-8 / DSM 12333 / CCUG 43141 / JCM 11478 / NBRC 16432 / NCIMB 13614 / HKI 0122) TaxID=471853 RepID=C5C0M5_BEUC1|nr:PadR family transcriptional regulator [Beutenbergia cavernae]ACQ81421.1 transcriptional regulator, PadR-like family [Beutenbergia cavernae DSM 12333]
MSVRNGLIALLSERPMGVYELRKEFDARTGGTWPVNIGQVYATVQRLVRDELVEPLPEDYEVASDVEFFRLTEAGYVAAEAWWAAPVDRSAPGRDELVIKLALAVSAPGVDVGAVVQAQRAESMRALRDFTRLKAGGPAPEQADRDTLAWSLVLDHLTFAAEAEVRWLDHVEVVVTRAAHGVVALSQGDSATDDATAVTNRARR